MELKRRQLNRMDLWGRAIFLFAAFLGLAFSPIQLLAFQSTEQKFSDSDFEFFENKIRPILVEHCLECHGSDSKKLRGGLHLTSRELMLSGGDSGPAIVPNKPDESLLIQSVRYEEFEMPPKGKLADSEIADLVKWIELGAPDPRTGSAAIVTETIDIEEGKKHWSFQPVMRHQRHQLYSEFWASWMQTPIDRFVADELIKFEIQPVADATREKLIRRAHIALTGLPPTLGQIDAFVDDKDKTEIAFAKVVDRLLDSKHFGERWGRHWLDVARFAESSGGGRSLMFKDAWRFRDYVINAYNADKPFDQFIKEQIAGDLLPYDSHEQKIEHLVATGFLALGPTNYEQQDKELLRMEVIDEQVDTVGRAFLGLTLGCARCHDHKFDPIPTSDYYAMAGIFGATKSLVDGNVSKYVEQTLETEEQIQVLKSYNADVASLTQKLNAANNELELIAGKPVKNNKRYTPNSADLPGIIVDNRQAKLVGRWVDSVHSKRFVDKGYIHDDNKNKVEKKVVFAPKLVEGGQYEVRMSYNSSGGRASNVPVTIDHQDGKTLVVVNQSAAPPIDGLFISLGTFRFEADTTSSVTIEAKGTDGHVIVDSVQFLKVDPEKPDDDTAAKENKQNKDSTKASNSAAGKSIEVKKQDLDPEAKAKQAKIERLNELIKTIDVKLKKLKENSPRSSAVAMSVKDEPKPVDGHIHIRGSVRNLGPVVKRGFIAVCCDEDSTPEIGDKESGRLQLAQWIADPDHPLTARVYVNRVWRHLFGVGLVESSDNFGKVGRTPSHPELLDHLAAQFVEEGWSTKKLIRQIMLSRVYQLSSDFDENAFARDQTNRLLWRSNRRRVDAEVLRDSILFVSGELDTTPGGLTIRKLSQYDLAYEFDTVKRSVYVPAFRNSMLGLFEVFDFANPNLVVGHRNTSTLPTQALFLMNSPTVMDQAKASAKRLLSEEENDSKRIKLAYRRMLGRYPSDTELEKSLNYLQSFDQYEKGNDDKIELQAWTSLCHALFASLDFRYVD